MRKILLRKFIPLVIFSSFLVTGCTTTDTSQPTDQAVKAAPAAKTSQNVYKGKVVGKSNKAKTISIKVGKGDAAKTMMVKFNDETKGVEHAVKGHASIIEYKVVGSDKIATVVKPKLAKLPQGVVEAQPEYVADLVAKGGNYLLVDSRPANRFKAGSLPTAVSIPVPMIKADTLAVLPKDKNTELIFFCGGPT